MPLKKGAHLDGVHDVESLRGRCWIDPDTDCWHLRDARGRRLRYEPRNTPRLFVHQVQGKLTARRAAWLLSGKPPVREGHVLMLRCQCWDCANPAHVVEVTAAEHGAKMAELGVFKTPAKLATARVAARKRRDVKLTEELAQWARESHQSQREIGHALGVPQTRISDIVRGKVWRPIATPGSVFDWGRA